MSATGLTKKQAEQRLHQLIDSTTKSAGRVTITVEGLHDRYIADKGQRLKQTTTVADYNSITRNHLAPYFGSRPIDSLTKKDMRGFVDYLIGRGLKAKSIDNYFTYAASLLNYAVEEQLLPASPARGVTLPEDADHVDELRFLEVFEVHDLIEHASAGLYWQIDRALYATAAMAGLRQGELLVLRWRSVDFPASRIRVEENVVRTRRSTTKSRKSRSVPMSHQVAAELPTLRELTSWNAATASVFADPLTGAPLARTPLMRRYRQALKGAGLDPAFKFHDLRHTAATTMARSGFPVTTIQALMGHSNLATTQRYMHYAPSSDEADRLGAAFTVADPRSQSRHVLSVPDITERNSATLKAA